MSHFICINLTTLIISLDCLYFATCSIIVDMRLSYRDFFFGLVLILLPFSFPVFKFSDVNTLVAATSAIFAIVAGFFIADAMSNYLRLQTLIAEENSALITISKDVKKIDENDSVLINEIIDSYMVEQLDSGTLAHTVKTRPNIDELEKTIDSIKSKDSPFFDHVLNAMETVRVSRQEISLAAKRNLGPAHWTALITLDLVVISSVLALRDGGIFMNIVATAIIFSTYVVLVLLREIDNNHMLEKKLAFENPRDVFHAIGKPPYYPVFSPESYRIPDENGNMRIGK